MPLHENVLPVVERVLDKECLLSSFCSLVLGPGQEAQPIHEDTQLIPLPRPHIPITVNAIWALSDFRARQWRDADRAGQPQIRFLAGIRQGIRRRHRDHAGRQRDAVRQRAVAWRRRQHQRCAGASRSPAPIAGAGCGSRRICSSAFPRRSRERFPRRLQELCGYSVYKGQFGHIDNRDPIELLGRERGKRMVWEATDAKKARMDAK